MIIIPKEYDSIADKIKACYQMQEGDWYDWIKRLEAERDRLKEQLAGKWIAVEDRLPEPNEDCLILTEGGTYEVDTMSKTKLFTRDHPIKCSDSVAYWQPLPTPPEKQE